MAVDADLVTSETDLMQPQSDTGQDVMPFIRTDDLKIDHGTISTDQIVEMPIGSIQPAPENDLLYRAVTDTDPDVIALAQSVATYGVREPLVISLDQFILSGHRRHRAATLAGLTKVPCRIEAIRRSDPAFLQLLREYNRQRVKSLDEITREEVSSADPEEAHRLLVDHRRAQGKIEETDTVVITGKKHRAAITAAKRPFLAAIHGILQERKKYWPLSVRQIHYVLLNNPPLIHASKRSSKYRNNKESYKAAIDLIARARLVGDIPWNAIDDETRPITTWNVHASIAPFVRGELNDFLKRYYRNLQQSQPNHIEIVAEKNTVASIVKDVAAEYCIPVTIGRGYSSLPPRYKMAQRFRLTGKEKLIILVISDFDPEGEDIPHSFARSMRDDFGIDDLAAIKVALTYEQISELNLHSNNLEEKKAGARYKRFVEQFGSNGYELEAVDPDVLQDTLRSMIDKVIDTELFNAEVEAEKNDAAHLDGVRRAVQSQLADVNWESA